jgi:hypothetical protein
MINTREELLNFLFKVEPSYKDQYNRYLERRNRPPTMSGDTTNFANFIVLKLNSGIYKNAANLFQSIESLLDDETSSDEIKDAVCTCFLENLINYASNGRIPYECFVPFLGSQSRDYCKVWDEFTGVKTPGLWENEEPNFAKRFESIPDDEAIAIIRAIKNHDFVDSEEEEKQIRFLTAVFPGIDRLLFYERRVLTPEQILAEFKKNIPK